MAFQAAQIAGTNVWAVFEDGKPVTSTQENAERLVALLNDAGRVAKLEAVANAARTCWDMMAAQNIGSNPGSPVRAWILPLFKAVAELDAPEQPALSDLLGAAPDILPPGVSSEDAEKRSWQRE